MSLIRVSKRALHIYLSLLYVFRCYFTKKALYMYVSYTCIEISAVISRKEPCISLSLLRVSMLFHKKSPIYVCIVYVYRNKCCYFTKSALYLHVTILASHERSPTWETSCVQDNAHSKNPLLYEKSPTSERALFLHLTTSHERFCVCSCAPTHAYAHTHVRTPTRIHTCTHTP